MRLDLLLSNGRWERVESTLTPDQFPSAFTKALQDERPMLFGDDLYVNPRQVVLVRLNGEA